VIQKKASVTTSTLELAGGNPEVDAGGARIASWTP
jgi:hypothetical protein